MLSRKPHRAMSVTTPSSDHDRKTSEREKIEEWQKFEQFKIEYRYGLVDFSDGSESCGEGQGEVNGKQQKSAERPVRER